MASTYRFWLSVFGRMVRPRLDRMSRFRTSAGRAPGRQLGPAGDQLEQFLEQPLGYRPLGWRTGNGDLIAAHVKVGADGVLDDPEQLVAGAEQADHRLLFRDDNLDLGALAVRPAAGGSASRARLGVTASGGSGATAAGLPASA
jgi:hypothetical protein